MLVLSRQVVLQRISKTKSLSLARGKLLVRSHVHLLYMKVMFPSEKIPDVHSFTSVDSYGGGNISFSMHGISKQLKHKSNLVDTPLTFMLQGLFCKTLKASTSQMKPEYFQRK